MKIGIPRAGYYHTHGPLWEAFFTELGFEVVTSPNSNPALLDLGLKEGVSESCLPLKILLGHVRYLAPKADLIFVPFSNNDDRFPGFVCPIFAGAPFLAATQTAPNKILSLEIDLANFRNLQKTIFKLDPHINTSFLTNKQLKHAYKSARTSHRRWKRSKRKAYLRKLKNSRQNKKFTIQLIGRPYVIFDSLLNMNIQKEITSRGLNVITRRFPRKKTKPDKRKRFHFHHANELKDIVRESQKLYEKGLVTGAIYLNPFSCGPDFGFEEYIRKLRTKNFPLLHLTVDENLSTAGVVSRLEAFIDMLKKKKR